MQCEEATTAGTKKVFLEILQISQKNTSAKVYFCKCYCNKFILTSAFICLQSSFLFQHGKKAIKTYIILLYMFLFSLLLQEISS